MKIREVTLHTATATNWTRKTWSDANTEIDEQIKAEQEPEPEKEYRRFLLRSVPTVSCRQNVDFRGDMMNPSVHETTATLSQLAGIACIM